MSSQFVPMRSLEDKVNDIRIKDGQFIVTDKGNIHVSMPDSEESGQRLTIRGAMIPIVLMEDEYNTLAHDQVLTFEDGRPPLVYNPNGIYMIIRNSQPKEIE